MADGRYSPPPPYEEQETKPYPTQAYTPVPPYPVQATPTNIPYPVQDVTNAPTSPYPLQPMSPHNGNAPTNAQPISPPAYTPNDVTPRLENPAPIYGIGVSSGQTNDNVMFLRRSPRQIEQAKRRRMHILIGFLMFKLIIVILIVLARVLWWT